MILIGISGKKQHGKDTVADMLLQKFAPHKGVKIAFADSLYDEVAKATGFPVPHIKERKDNFRLILQGWGTNFRRQVFGDDYWIKQYLKKLLNNESDLVVTPDVRFINEASCIQLAGGCLIRVSRSGMSGDQDNHPSETELDNYNKWDYVVRNDGSLKELELTLDEIVLQLRRQHNIKM